MITMVGQSLEQMGEIPAVEPQPTLKVRLATLAKRPEATAVLLLVGLATFLSFAASSFRTSANLIWVLHSFSVVGIAAMGILLLIVSGKIDLSAGSQIGMSAILTGWFLYYHPEVPHLLVFAIAILSGACFGLANAFFVTKVGLNPFIATLATDYVGRGLIIIISGNITFQNFPKSLTFIGQGSIGPLPILVWVMLVLVVIWSWVVLRTKFGRWVFAVGGNPSAARLSGVPVDFVNISTFILSGMMCALAGFLFCLRLGVASATLGIGYGLDIIAGSVIGGVSVAGGTGTMVGVVLGAGLMAMIRNGLVLMQIGALWQQLVTGIMVVFSVIIDRLRRRSE